jgi:hypothetical protein
MLDSVDEVEPGDVADVLCDWSVMLLAGFNGVLMKKIFVDFWTVDEDVRKLNECIYVSFLKDNSLQ